MLIIINNGGNFNLKIPLPTKYGLKILMPIFNKEIEKSLNIKLDRENRKKIIKTVTQCKKLMKNTPLVDVITADGEKVTVYL